MIEVFHLLTNLFTIPLSKFSFLSADNLCKQFGPISGSNMFDILTGFLKESFIKIDFKKLADDNNKIFIRFFIAVFIAVVMHAKYGKPKNQCNIKT